MALWEYSKGWSTWSKKVFSKRYTFPCYRAAQSTGSTRQPPFTTLVKPSIKHIVIFTKLNHFEILLYVTFITMKVSRSTVLPSFVKLYIFHVLAYWTMCRTSCDLDGWIGQQECNVFLLKMIATVSLLHNLQVLVHMF